RVALNARSQQAHGRSGRLIKTKRGTLHRPQRGIHGFLDLAPRISQSLELLLRILNVCRTVEPGRDEGPDTGDSRQRSHSPQKPVREPRTSQRTTSRSLSTQVVADGPEATPNRGRAATNRGPHARRERGPRRRRSTTDSPRSTTDSTTEPTADRPRPGSATESPTSPRSHGPTDSGPSRSSSPRRRPSSPRKALSNRRRASPRANSPTSPGGRRSAQSRTCRAGSPPALVRSLTGLDMATRTPKARNQADLCRRHLVPNRHIYPLTTIKKMQHVSSAAPRTATPYAPCGHSRPQSQPEAAEAQ